MTCLTFRNQSICRGLLKGLASLCLAAASAPLSAQDQSDVDMDVYYLNPFVVDTTQDEGYLAGNTTSGSRLNASLRDTASAITALTAEFMQDFNITGLDDLVNYGPNMAVDMQDTSGDANPTFLSGSDFNNTRIRIRGLSASVTRDFFQTNLPIDGYNASRVEVASGPNAILFGIGAPGGLVNWTTKQASVDVPFTEIKAVLGSWNLGRLEIDHSQPIVDKKLAFRVNVLAEDRNDWRDWEFRTGTRATFSGLWIPFRRTEVQLSYETGYYDESIARPMNIYDNTRLWFESGSPVLSDSDWNTALRAQGVNRIAGTRITHFTSSLNDDSYTITRSAAAGAAGRILVTTFDDFGVPTNQRAGQTLVTGDRIPYEFNFYGPDSQRNADFERLFFSLQQKLSANLVFNLAYNRERTSQETISIVVGNLTLNGDPNLDIPDPAGTFTRVPNPNAGGVYVESRWLGNYGFADSDMLRATLAWDLNLGKFGRHQMAFMGELGNIEESRMARLEILADDNGVPLNNASTPENNANWIWRANYISLDDPATWRAASWRENITVERDGRYYQNRFIDSNAGGFLSRDVKSLLAVTQSYFFDNHLVVTAGVRKDYYTYDSIEELRYTANDPEVVSGEKIVGEWKYGSGVGSTFDYNPTTITAGAVYHFNDVFSVFYNQANNNDAPRQNYAILPDENIPEPVEGKTRDFGFMLNLLDGKLFVRVTRYETEQLKNVGGSFTIPLYRNETNIIAPSTRILDTLLENSLITDQEYADHVLGGEGTLAASSDVTNSGYEFNAGFNFTKNWTGSFNYAYTETDRSNIAPEFEGWFEREKAFWFASPGSEDLVNLFSSQTLAEEALTIEEIMVGVRDFYSFGYGISEHQFSFTSRYSFTEVLKGLFVGGGVRWESAPPLGRAYLGRDENNQVINGEVIEGDERWNVDAFIGYRTPLKIFGMKKSRMVIQLNVKNLTDEKVVVPLRFNQGETGLQRVLLKDPRSFQFTIKVSF